MSIENRPYIGSWKPNVRKTRIWSPDALVYINGDTQIPGCRTCNHKIDLMQFITSISVSAGTDSSGLSGSFNFSIPKHHGDSIFLDGNFVLVTGLEVNIYFKGFFAQKNLLQNTNTQIQMEDSSVYELKDLEFAPFYPVFHGVISEVSYAYSSGFYSGSVTCRSILSFWDTQFLNNNAAVFASQATENRGSFAIAGHPFKNNTPYQIIYKLYRDTAGQAHGVATALSNQTNALAKTPGGEDYYSLTVRYWEKRFAQGMYGLRMYGVNGRLFSALEQNFFATKTFGEIGKLLKSSIAKSAKPDEVAKGNKAVDNDTLRKLGLISTGANGKVNRSLASDFYLIPQQSENKQEGVNILQLQHYIEDISAYGNVNLWQSDYESKMEIANSVAEKAGFEFYQDVDGDLVFKPPLYNMDTSESRVYRIQPEDIISIDFSNSEPEYTYIICKGGPFQNTKGFMDDEDMGFRSTYIDYKLVAQYGWKPFEFDTTYYTDAKSAYYAAAFRLDELNKGMHGCSLSIPMRPELKPGYPIYIEHIDCFYYVTAVSHSFSFGGECTTSLTLTARRKKFIPPGDPQERFDKNPAKAINFEDTYLPQKYLKTRQTAFNIGGADLKETSISNDVVGTGANPQQDEQAPLRTVGFPNVVMGLDPKRLDPSFLAMPVFETDQARDVTRHMIILQALKAGIISLYNPNSFDEIMFDESSPDQEGGDKFFKGPWVVYYPPSANNGTKVQAGILKLDNGGTLAGESIFYQATKDRKDARKKAINIADDVKKRTAIEEADKAYEEAIKSITKVSQNTTIDAQLTIADLWYLLKEYLNSKNSLVSQDAGSTSSIISLLSNKKGSFNPHIPGYYRYYSCSHPNPAMQGALELNYDGTKTRLKVPEGELSDFEPFYAVVGVKDDEIKFEVKSPTDRFVKRGFKTKTLTKGFTSIVPTSEITSVCFQRHSTRFLVRVHGIKLTQPLKSTATGDELKKLEVQTALLGLRSSMEKFFSDLQAKNKYTEENIRSTRKEDLIGLKTQLASKPSPKSLTTYIQKQLYAISSDLNSLNLNLKDVFSAPNAYTEVVSKSKVLTFTSGTLWNEKKFSSAILPVSDKKGYEVFGAYAYGRGLNIQPGANYEEILKRDPLRLLGQSDIDSILSQFKSSNENLTEAKIKKVTSYLNSLDPNSEQYNAVVGIAKETLGSNVPRLPDGSEDKVAILNNGLANLFASNETTQVITNVPRRLSQMNPSPLAKDGIVCECRAVESDVDIEAMGAEFMNIDYGIPQLQGDPIMSWYQQQMVSKIQDWSSYQEALRTGGTSTSDPNTVYMPNNPLPNIYVNSYSELNPTKIFGENGGFDQGDQIQENLMQTFQQATVDYQQQYQKLQEAGQDITTLDYNNTLNNVFDTRARNIDKLKRDK